MSNEPTKLILPLVVADHIVMQVRESGQIESTIMELERMMTRIMEFHRNGPVGDGMDPVPVDMDEEDLPPDEQQTKAIGEQQVEAGQVLEFESPAQFAQWVRERLSA